MAELFLGAALWHSLGGLDGQAQNRVFQSRRQLQREVPCSLEENVLPLLQYWCSPRVKRF